MRVRDVTVENIRLERSYHRGAVEASDGTDNITIRNVFAQDAVYAVDVQDHGAPSAPNTNILVEHIEALRCKHALRTANGPRGHAQLTLRNIRAIECALPLQISHTTGVQIEQLNILGHTDPKLPPVQLKNCAEVVLKTATIQSRAFAGDPVQLRNTTGVLVEGLKRRD